VGYGTGEAVKLPDHHDFELALVSVCDQAIQFGTTLLAARDAYIDVLTDKSPSSTETVLSYFSGL
jgi:hypothetical protein